MTEKDQADSAQGAGSTPRSQAARRRLIGLCCKCPWGTIRRSLCGVALTVPANSPDNLPEDPTACMKINFDRCLLNFPTLALSKSGYRSKVYLPLSLSYKLPFLFCSILYHCPQLNCRPKQQVRLTALTLPNS